MGIGVGALFRAVIRAAADGLRFAAAVAIVAWLALRRGFGPSELSAALGTLAAIGAGFVLVVVRAQTNDVEILTRETRTVTISGRVSGPRADRPGPYANPACRTFDRTGSARKTSEANPHLRRQSAGGSLTRRLDPIARHVAPASRAGRTRARYDFGRKLWFDGIGAVGFSLGSAVRIPPPRPDTLSESVPRAIQSFRHAVSDRIRAAMSERAGPIGAAFLTGERGLISEEDNEAMRDSSLAHLLSISGLHMVLAGFGFFAALRLIAALIPANCAQLSGEEVGGGGGP